MKRAREVSRQDALRVKQGDRQVLKGSVCCDVSSWPAKHRQDFEGATSNTDVFGKM